MNSSARVFEILGLFTRERPVWQPDEINEALGYSRPTEYRTVEELVEAGMLQKVAVAHYSLGPRIIELDHQLRQTDPVLLAAAPAMQQLAQASQFDAVLTVMFAGPRIVDTHRVSVDGQLRLAYGRGRPRPIFRSAAPKILLAHQGRAALARLYAAHAAAIAAHGLGASWAAFRAGLTQIRRQGHYRSLGELEPGVGSVAVPVFNADHDCVAALALVGSEQRIAALPADALVHPLRQAATAMQRSLTTRAAGGNSAA